MKFHEAPVKVDCVCNSATVLPVPKPLFSAPEELASMFQKLLVTVPVPEPTRPPPFEEEALTVPVLKLLLMAPVLV